MNEPLSKLIVKSARENAMEGVIKEIRESDCGAWLKDCGTVMFTCADGREKRQELSRLLDKLYKVSNI